MRRILGYIFLGLVACAGLVGLYARLRGGSTLNPFVEEGPDWFGVGLILSAIAAGIWLLFSAAGNGKGKFR